MLLHCLKRTGLLALLLLVACTTHETDAPTRTMESTSTALAPTAEEIAPTTSFMNAEYPAGWTSYTDANYITDLAFDRDGYLWTASRGGVTRWDPSNGTYERFTVEDGLPSNYVTAIWPARDGKVWIGTNYGTISAFDGTNWQAYVFSQLSKYMEITDIYQDSGGNIWFTTNGAGAIKYDGRSWRFYMLEDGLASVAISGLTEDARGALWFETYVPCCMSMDTQNVHDVYGKPNGMKVGITRYLAGSWSIISDEFGVTECCTDSQLAVRGKDLWIAPCTNGNICRYDGKNLEEYPVKETVKFNVGEISVDSNNNLWFFSYGNMGAVKFDGQNWIRFTKEDGLLDNYILAATAGPDGSMWFGTAVGISGYDGKSWRSLVATDLQSSLPTMNINDLSIGPDNVVWLATYTGINRFDSTKWQVIDTDNGLPVTNDVRSIAVTPNNEIWIGNVYWPDGGGDHSSVLYYDGLTWTNFKEAQASDEIVLAHEGSVWFRDFDKIYKYSHGQWQTFQLGNYSKTNMLSTPDGTLWLVGGEGPGAYYLKGGSWVLGYDGEVERMAVAPDGTLWLAEVIETKNKDNSVNQIGLSFSSFDGSKWNRQFVLPGMSGIFGKSMAFSSDGSLWVCPNYKYQDPLGVYRYFTGEWSHYTMMTGLSGNAVEAIYPAPDGSVWFVTEGGLTRYDNIH